MDDYDDIWDRHRVEALLANAESMLRKYGDAVSIVAAKARLRHKEDDEPKPSQLFGRRPRRGTRDNP